MRGFVATLNNGQIISEENSSWTELKSYLIQNKLKIIDLQLAFDHQKVFCRRNANTYFYAKKVEAWLNTDLPGAVLYGIGCEERNGTVTISWFDGNNAIEEIRIIKKDDLGIWIN